MTTTSTGDNRPIALVDIFGGIYIFSKLPKTGFWDKCLEMYGPPSDCKGKVDRREDGLGKCIRPLVEIESPGLDELRACLSL